MTGLSGCGWAKLTTSPRGAFEGDVSGSRLNKKGFPCLRSMNVVRFYLFV